MSITEHPATLPEVDIPEDVDHLAITRDALSRLDNLTTDGLADDAIWRDHLAFTGTLRTFFRPKLVAHVWQNLAAIHKPSSFKVLEKTSQVFRLGSANWVEARFEFRTEGSTKARCSGTIGLVPAQPDGREWKIWLLCTILEQPDGFPDVDDLRPPSQRPNGSKKELPAQVDCAVIGAGVAGLNMAARLQSLGLSYVLVDKHAQVGDTWVLDRYEAVKLHTSKSFNQLPGNPATFGKDEPYHLPGKNVAEGFRRFAETFGLNVFTSTTLESAAWDERSDGWDLSLRRSGGDDTLQARHVVLAVGSMGIEPQVPEYKDRHLFKGDVVHGIQWKNARAWQGKRGVVVGSANTAHDVIADMANANFEAITMIQRSKTFLLPVPTFAGLVDLVYNEDTPLEVSDRILMSYPLAVQRWIGKKGIAVMADSQQEYFDRVAAGGFNIERYGDLWGLLYDREGGHFFDLGSGELIANGTVKVSSGEDKLPVAYTETGLRLGDGSSIDADVIVFATGYSTNILPTAKKLFGQEIGNSLREFWQCDAEGEIRGAWRQTGRKCSQAFEHRCVC